LSQLKRKSDSFTHSIHISAFWSVQPSTLIHFIQKKQKLPVVRCEP